MIPTGVVSLQDVEDEFGGGQPIPLGDYYVDGPSGLVQTGWYSTILGNPPYSGPISLADFRGVSKITSFIFNDVVSSNLADYNLRNRAINAGWDGVIQLTATITINPGVYVYASTTGNSAFVLGTPTLPAGSTVSLTNNGFIAGRGGQGGQGGSVTAGVASNGAAGGTGGTALTANYAISITNNGTIGGGGGGGGGGSSQGYVDKSTIAAATGGGGGGGRSLGGFGAAGASSGNTSGTFNGTAGTAGTLGGPGAGGAGSGHGPVGPDGGQGGAGGGFGSPGSAGELYNNGQHTSISSPGGGGAAGAAVTGNAFITWLVTGTRLGSIS